MPLTITPAQFDHYWKKGWLVVEGVFKPEIVERLAQRGLELIAPEIKPETGGYKVDRSPDGKELAPRKLDAPFQRDRLYGEAIFASAMPDLKIGRAHV